MNTLIYAVPAAGVVALLYAFVQASWVQARERAPKR